MTTADSVALVMPAHNEADTIEDTVRGFHETLDSMDVTFDIVVAEDGSTDGTKDVVRRLREELGIIPLLQDSRRGYSGALIDAMEAVDRDYVVFVDSDGQHFPADLGRLWEHRTDAPIIVGGRYDRADSPFRRIMSDAFRLLATVTFDLPEISDVTAPFRLVERDVALEIISDIRHMRESFWTEFTIRAATYGHDQLEIPVRHRKRQGPDTTRVYHVSDLPSIVVRQLVGLWKLRQELGERRPND